MLMWFMTPPGRGKKCVEHAKCSYHGNICFCRTPWERSVPLDTLWKLWSLINNKATIVTLNMKLILPGEIWSFLKNFKLKDNCFIEFCCFLPNSNMNQSWVHLCPLPLESYSHFPPLPTPLGCYRAPLWVSWLIWQIPTGYLFYIW